MVWMLFFALAALAVVSALVMVLHKNPVYSAVFLILTFFSLAGLYYLLEAPFLSIVQVIVYAGAIMVLFLFVIMLLQLREEMRLPVNKPFQIVFSALFVVILLVQLLLLVLAAGPLLSTSVMHDADAPVLGRVEALGLALFTDYIYPFEIASLLLLVGIIGAILLGRKKWPNEA
jgi:NADH-quinone oxidoreductase subunit J